MSIQDKSRKHSKVKRLDENTTIHNLFIFNKSGICFYGKSFTDFYNMEKNLISPFLTALMSFSKEMIGKKFKTIDMGDIKLAIFEKKDIYYGILCDTIENVILLNEGDFIDLSGLKLEVLNFFGHTNDAIALMDRKNRNIFVGDAILNKTSIYYVQAVFMPPDFHESELLQTFNKLRARKDATPGYSHQPKPAPR